MDQKCSWPLVAKYPTSKGFPNCWVPKATCQLRKNHLGSSLKIHILTHPKNYKIKKFKTHIHDSTMENLGRWVTQFHQVILTHKYELQKTNRRPTEPKGIQDIQPSHIKCDKRRANPITENFTLSYPQLAHRCSQFART